MGEKDRKDGSKGLRARCRVYGLPQKDPKQMRAALVNRFGLSAPVQPAVPATSSTITVEIPSDSALWPENEENDEDDSPQEGEILPLSMQVDSEDDE